MERIKALRQRKAGLLDEKKVLVDEASALSAKEEAGTISADEQTRLDALMSEGGLIDAKNAEIAAQDKLIAREERLMDERRSAPAPVIEEPAAITPQIRRPGERPSAQPRGDGQPTPRFATFGEQLSAIATAAMNPGVPFTQIHPALSFEHFAAPSGANESTPSEGGFLVQQDFSTRFLSLMHEQGELIRRVSHLPIGANFNGIRFPIIDETSRANGSRWGGVLAYWVDEAETVPPSKPKFAAIELKLKKLMAIGYATDELLADAPALEAIFTQAFTEELVFKTEDAIINGTGSGQPLGILGGGAVVTVTPESGQAAATMRSDNILKMWSRTPIRSRRNLVWLINQDIEPQMWGLTLGNGAAALRLWTPPGAGGNDSSFGTLMGRPVIPIEYMPTLGTAGDILLFDPSQYIMIDKGGMQAAQSMHVRFLYDEMAFRFTYRVDGAPLWRKATTPYKGSATLSPYVVLGSR